MAAVVNMKNVVKHIIDGNIARSLCRVCLQPLGGVFENIFTRIYKKNVEFCVADVLQNLCGMQFYEIDDYYVCADCFVTACTAHKFYTLCQRSNEILSFYIDNLNQNVDLFDNSLETNNSFCITLPEIEPSVQNIDVEEMTAFLSKPIELSIEEEENDGEVTKHKNNSISIDISPKMKPEKIDLNDSVMVIVKENGVSKFYQVKSDGQLECVNKDSVKSNVIKKRRQRDPMEYRTCSKCPIQYRFLAKLKEHMKADHDINMQICKVCKAVFENEEDFDNHLKTHTNIHLCALCNAVFKKRDTIIAHLKWHESVRNLSQQEGVHICEICGFMLANEDEMKEHYDKKHDKKYNCYYCGKLYKSEISFDMHIKKHEEHMSDDEKKYSVSTTNAGKPRKKVTAGSKKRYECPECDGKTFVDERALKWHTMLHTNDRPFKCDVCSKGFISVNRRNQHTLCAHSAPSKRCPLCPALFHLRSMVNTHIKKVHLKAHKRRNRTSKHQNNVFWRTEPVPIQELSVSVQNELLEMKASREIHLEDDEMI